MRLASLTVENYRRFRRAELEFPDGVIGLVGRNGAGKSTLVEAIGWALFGHDAARTGKELLRLRGAKGDLRVALAFELGGEQYEVVRELTAKGAHTATVKVGGGVQVAAGANSAKDATLFLERALRMDRDTFFASLIARQGELSALTELTPSKRKEVVMRMLRIDAIDVAIDLARDAKRRLQAHLEGLGAQRSDPGALAARAQELAKAREAEQAHAGEAQRALEGTEESLEAVGRARAALDELARRDQELRGRAALAQSQAQGAERALARAREQLTGLEQVSREHAALQPSLAEHERARAAVEALEGLRDRHRERQRALGDQRAGEEEAEQLARQRERLQAELAPAPAARRELEEARSSRVALEQAHAGARAELAGLVQPALDARNALGQAAARRAELERLGAEAHCPTCEQPLAAALPTLLARLDEEVIGARARAEALQRRARHAEERARQAAEQLQEAHAREDALKKRAEQLFRREGELALLEERRQASRARLDGLRARLAELGEVPFDEAAYVEQKRGLAALAKAHERGLQLRTRLDALPAVQEELARHDAERTRAAEQAALLERERAGLGFDAAQRLAIEERFASLQKRARVLVAEVEQRRGAVERIDAERARLAEEEQRQRALEAKSAELRREVVLLERLAGDRDAGLLADFRSHLMGRVRPALSERASELFRACTEAKYEGLELTEDYDLLVLEQGEPLPLARFSGGESDLANLCLRIAIGEVLAERSGGSLGFLALDEVLGSQDEQRRALILRALAHLRGRFRQILLITHIEEVKDALEHVVYVEDAEDGTSRLVPQDVVVPLAA